MEVHVTRPKGTVRNDKFKLFLTPASQVNVMVASIKELPLDNLSATK